MGMGSRGTHPVDDPQFTWLAFYDMNYTDGFTYIGGASPAIDDAVSHINDISTNNFDLSQLTGGLQPVLKQVNGKWVAQFDAGDTMNVGSVTGLNAASGFTIIIGGSVLTGGVDNATDYMFNVSDGVDDIALSAGHPTEFHADWLGTNVANLVDPDDVNLVNQGFQYFAWENGNAGDDVTSWKNNQVRTSAANTVQFGASCTFTLGGSLGFQVQYIAIAEGILTEAQHLQLARWAASEQTDITLISGEWGTRNTAVPVLNNTAPSISDTLSIASGNTWVNLRNEANVFSYQWENDNDGNLGTGATQPLSASDEGDRIRVEVTNTPLGAAGAAVYSAYTSPVTAVSFTPADLWDGNPSRLGYWLDPSDLTSMFTSAVGEIANQVASDGDVVQTMIDKSRCGSGNSFEDWRGSATNLFANPGFDADTDWTKEAGWTISGGVASVNASGAARSIYQNVSPGLVKYVWVEITISNYVSGSLRVISGNTLSSEAMSANGTYQYLFKTDTANLSLGFQAADGTQLDIDDAVSVHISDGTTDAKIFHMANAAHRPLYKTSAGNHWLDFGNVDNNGFGTHDNSVVNDVVNFMAGLDIDGDTSGIVFGTGSIYSSVYDDGSASTALDQNVGTPTYHFDGSAFAGSTRDDLHTAFNTSPPVLFEILDIDLSGVTSVRMFSYGSGGFTFSGNAYQALACPNMTAQERSDASTFINGRMP